MLLLTPALLQQQQAEQEQERSRDQEQEQLELKKKKSPELLLYDPFRVARVSNVTLQKKMRISA